MTRDEVTNELANIAEEMRIAGILNDRIKKTTDEWSARLHAIIAALGKEE